MKLKLMNKALNVKRIFENIEILNENFKKIEILIFKI